MQHETVDGVDFGVPVQALRPGTVDLFEVPVETIDAREIALPKVDMDAVKAQVRGEALRAAQDEVASKVMFTFENVIYRLERPEEWDIEAFEAREEGRNVTYLKVVLGEAQYEKWKTAKKRRATDMVSIINEIDKFFGAQQGESRA